MLRSFLILSVAGFLGWSGARAEANSVIFIHPDGAGVAHWQAARFLLVGPDGELNWDRLPHIGIYRGHMQDNLTATSNGGATTHAYGVKVPRAGFGSNGETADRPVAASGQQESIMHEALGKNLRTGLINSGSIIEPGTAAFVASVASRKEHEEITRQVLKSGVDVILSGGEEWMLPQGVEGRHGKGRRKDRLNLVEEAEAAGYSVVYTAEELMALPNSTKKVLGIFASSHTFFDQSPADQKKNEQPLYLETAPDLATMLGKTLQLFGDEKFFLVVEEEGTDNFGNNNHAPGTLEALRRADGAFAVAMDYLQSHPRTLIITAADSEAGNMDVIGLGSTPEAIATAIMGKDLNGAPYGLTSDGKPFLSAPDAAGTSHRFVISWGTTHDSSGGIVVRGAGLGAEQIRGTMDNTSIYRVMRSVLFGDSD